MTKKEQYNNFLKSKILEVQPSGFEINKDLLNPIAFAHQKDVAAWAIHGGCRAIFCSFGLGKTLIQLLIADAVSKHTEKPFMIGLPLAVVGEFKDDAEMLGVEVHYVKDQSEIALFHSNKPGIYLSNYERIREAKFKPEWFGGCSFDEGDAIRNLDTLTTDYIMTEFTKIQYKFIATATPSPNDYTEILNYAQFLGIMDRSQALTRFFQRDSTKAGNLTIYPHKEKEFWLWVKSWSVTFEMPSEINADYSDADYVLPEMKVIYHEVKVTERGEIKDRDGNYQMYADSSNKGLSATAKEKRLSIEARVNEAMAIIEQGNEDDHWILWHDLEDERHLLEKKFKGHEGEFKSVYGSQEQDVKEEILIDFKHGKFKYLATKPKIAGSGCNFQKHCHKAIYIGVGYKFKEFIQSIHRIYRFRQEHPVEIHLVHTDAEHSILKVLQAKWSRHKEMHSIMSKLIKTYGLSANIEELKRSIGTERMVVEGDSFKCIKNDAVVEAMDMEDNSVGMILTSIPFSDQYEYCESYNDMGHNNGNEEFFKQMDFLTPELYRILQPGRIACIHVKDRIVFSYQNGVGFTSLGDFMGETRMHFEKHGFFLIGKHFITTDVVRENNQTYRLGWTENSKDGTKMGAGSPELLLVFRKPPTDQSNAYADVPVTKSKQDYTRGRWQLDAHAFWKSSGERLLNSEELRKLRALVRYSNKGDIVYDPFGGLMTVPFRCIILERFGLATELNEISFKDGVRYCREAAYKKSVPTLFDLEKIA